jgi:CubicO group peptidase (beta-lactamase class C family)
VLGSAGKIISHIAALQLVDRGLITLDEPVDKHVPELAALPIISKRAVHTDGVGPNFELKAPTNKITLRHLLTHSSGIASDDHKLIQEWQTHAPQQEFPAETHIIVKRFSFPLIFEPGEGFCYGNSVIWLWLLITRVAGDKIKFVQENIFDILGMPNSTFKPDEKDDVKKKLLQMVERNEGGELVDADFPLQQLVCGIEDFRILLTDLISPSSKLLKPDTLSSLFTPSFASSSTQLANLRADTETYRFATGITLTPGADSPVNYTTGGLYVEDTLPLSGMPKGTVTWNGMANVIWAINREKGLGMLFVTQLLPPDDEKVIGVAMEFMRGAWANY